MTLTGRILGAALLVGAALFGAARPAAAQEDHFDAQNWKPAYDSYGFITVEGAKRMDPFQMHFAATFENFFDGDSDGRYDGRFRIRLTLHMLDADTFVGTATIDTLTLDGTTAPPPPFLGITVRATRMKVVRE